MAEQSKAEIIKSAFAKLPDTQVDHERFVAWAETSDDLKNANELGYLQRAYDLAYKIIKGVVDNKAAGVDGAALQIIENAQYHLGGGTEEGKALNQIHDALEYAPPSVAQEKFQSRIAKR